MKLTQWLSFYVLKATAFALFTQTTIMAPTFHLDLDYTNTVYNILVQDVIQGRHPSVLHEGFWTSSVGMRESITYDFNYLITNLAILQIANTEWVEQSKSDTKIGRWSTIGQIYCCLNLFNRQLWVIITFFWISYTHLNHSNLANESNRALLQECVAQALSRVMNYLAHAPPNSPWIMLPVKHLRFIYLPTSIGPVIRHITNDYTP